MSKYGALKSLLLLVFFVFWALPVLAQVDTVWVRRYNGSGSLDDIARAIAVDDSGNAYVTGNIYTETGFDYATMKYYPNGDTAWVRTYNGSGNLDDLALDLAVDGHGNVYVAGATDHSWPNESSSDYATIKYYPNGDTAWLRRYNGPGNSNDYALAIAVDDSGNVCVTGFSFDSTGEYNDYATIKYYPNGDTAWVRRYNGPGNAYDGSHDVAVDHSGYVYVTGYSDGVGTYTDFATIKYYPNGDTAWVRRYTLPGGSTDIAYKVAVDDEGNVYVTGGCYPGSATHQDYLTIKYNSDGDTVWVRTYNGPANYMDDSRAIAVDGSGNVFVTGISVGSDSSLDYATIKYYPNGGTAWVRRYKGSGNYYDLASAIAVDDYGDVYVSGGSYGSGTSFDYATVKYNSNGNELWVERYNGPGNGEDRVEAIAVDDSNNVYVTGCSYDGVTNLDYVTIKYYQTNEPPDSFSLLFPPNKAFTPQGVRFDWETATDPNPFDQVRYDLYVSTSYRFPLDSTTIDADLVASEHTRTLDYGTYYWKVKVKDNYGAERWSNQICYFMVTGIFYSGDLNGDGAVNIGDVIFLINYLYTSGPAPEPFKLGDVNCNNEVNVADVVFLINYLFKNGPPPSC
jgi:hypothetical protein